MTALQGIGMTSQRTRARMIERLREQGIRDERVLTAMAAVPHVLLDQLAPGGRLMLPLGSQDQVLCLVEKTGRGVVETRFDPVRFVPLLPGVA